MVRCPIVILVLPKIKTALGQYRSLFDFFAAWFVTVRVAMEENARSPLCGTVWTNQVGYITLIAQLLGSYGDVNRPCPRATPSDSGRFIAITPRQLGNNYYIHIIPSIANRA
jgi:hypothetical protein